MFPCLSAGEDGRGCRLHGDYPDRLVSLLQGPADAETEAGLPAGTILSYREDNEDQYIPQCVADYQGREGFGA